MSLDRARLEKVRELPGGMMQARCPACAEDGNDRKGEHLRIFANGSYGCCVHPKDKVHNRRIFALAGCKLPGVSHASFTLRIQTPAALPTGQSVKDSLRMPVGTLGTAIPESVAGVPSVPVSEKFDAPKSWDAWDGLNSPTRVRAQEQRVNVVGKNGEKLREWESPVPSVPRSEDWRRRHPLAPMDGEGRPLPYLGRDGRLVIPFDSDVRFHYWNGGQELEKTMAEATHRLGADK